MSAGTVDAYTADLAAVRADDALLDVLGGRDIDQAAVLADDRLNGLLLAWRYEVDRPPMPVLVDTTQAVALIEQTRPARPSLRVRGARSVSRPTRRTR